MRISIGPGSEYCPTTTGSSCACWKEPSTCGRQSMLSHIRLPYHLLIVHGHWTNACLFYTLFITKSTYVVCLPYLIPSLNSLWTNTIYPFLSYLRRATSRSSQRQKSETSPCRENFSSHTLRCHLAIFVQQLKILKYRKMLYIPKY